MRKRFFLGLLLVMALIWGPMVLWGLVEEWRGWMRYPIIIGIAAGGYLLWQIVVHSLIGRDK